jgi:tRNA (cmo5U34)-methyltransferase
MIPVQPTKNFTPYLPEDYDAKISNVIPYYLSFHQETINLVKSLSSSPKVWMDTGCGAGSLVSKAIEDFPYTKFLLVDPSEGMLIKQGKKCYHTLQES